jgi:hypothetical protein
MCDQPLVVLAQRIGHTRHRQTILILLVGERYAVAPRLITVDGLNTPKILATMIGAPLQSELGNICP